MDVESSSARRALAAAFADLLLSSEVAMYDATRRRTISLPLTPSRSAARLSHSTTDGWKRIIIVARRASFLRQPKGLPRPSRFVLRVPTGHRLPSAPVADLQAQDAETPPPREEPAWEPLDYTLSVPEKPEPTPHVRVERVLEVQLPNPPRRDADWPLDAAVTSPSNETYPQQATQHPHHH